MSTFTVTNTNNSGTGSLRQAVLDANALSGKDIINFGGLFTDGLAHTISLTGSSLSITDNLTIEGTNPSLLTIKDDSASRVFDIASGVTSAINGLTITNSYDEAGGGGGISNEGVLTLSNSIITGNTAKSNTTDPDNGYLLGEGGGIHNTGSLTVNHSIITGNTADQGGGGIYNDGSLIVNYSTMTGNTADQGGGGIQTNYFDGTSMMPITTLNYSTIAGNTASSGGGIQSSGSLTVNYSSITDNTAAYSGGGIQSDDNPVTVNHSNISGNTAEYGGGINITDGIGGTPISVSNSSISDNTASNGGGIYITGGTPTLSVNNSSISDNTAGSGGGIYIDGDNPLSATITVSNSTISGNSVLGDGGGIYDGAPANGIYDTTGAIINFPGSIPYSINIINSIISGNSAQDGGGGGIYNYNGQYSNATSSTISVSNSIISGNTAQYGGGIYNLGIITLSNSIISGNSTSLTSPPPDPELVEPNVIDSGTNGGGIYNGGFTYPVYKDPDNVAYGKLTVINSIISNNSASSGGGIYNNGILSVSYSSISHNYARDYGGGIYNSSSNEFSLSYPDFNESSKYNTLGIVTVTHSSISGNTALTAGGGIYNDPDQDFGKIVEFLKGTDLSANITYDGLGIVQVSYSVISDNQAHFGAGIYNNATLTVGNSIIRHNKAFGIELSSSKFESGKGGGIYNSNSSYATATIDYSIVACNFDTPEEDSNKFIKLDNIVGKFITKGSLVRV
ncbi:MAG: hypothetical protein V7L27_13380 [Nostoc sp.]|uniref:beta strand repeat-containing protein n=1 Tax=Nostoc sp. TaxID=1180 RepID=UPI002FF9563A